MGTVRMEGEGRNGAFEWRTCMRLMAWAASSHGFPVARADTFAGMNVKTGHRFAPVGMTRILVLRFHGSMGVGMGKTAPSSNQEGAAPRYRGAFGELASFGRSGE